MPEQTTIEQISKRLRPLNDEQMANAAVTMILNPDENGFDILFVKRVESMGDPWSGQIGLPGGKSSPEDKNLQQTAVRESLEETGIELLDGRFLGVLPAQRPGPRPELLILPFVVLFNEKPIIRLNEKELESFIWIPLQQILKNKKTVRLGSQEKPAYVVGKTVVWGLTYRILESFIQIIKNVKT